MTGPLISTLRVRLLAGVALASALLAWHPPGVSAECMGPGPVGADEVPQVGYAFIATVTEASEDVDPVEDMAAYDWHIELSTERTYLGTVPPSLVYNGWEYGCHEFRGDGLRTGDRIFVASESLHSEFLPGDPFSGDVLVWRWDGSGWAFYVEAMSGAEFDDTYYPKAARIATTTSEILAIVAAGTLPDTSTADAADAQIELPLPLTLLLAGLLALLLSLLSRRDAKSREIARR